MNYLQQVQKGVDFIEENLAWDFTLDEVAVHAGISQWHFQRIFKALTHETLKTYIRSRRLANSLDALLRSDDRIIEIALAAGFQSQESFTRAFKKSFNLTPHQYRKLGDESLFLNKVQFNTRYLNHINERISLVPEFITQPGKSFIGMKTRFQDRESAKNNISENISPLWTAFMARAGEIRNPASGPYYGLVQPTGDAGNYLDYYAVVGASKFTEIPEGMVCINIPAATYACFIHKGDARLVDDTVNYIYSNWLLRSGKNHTYGADMEIYDDDYIANSEQSIMRYAIPVR